RSGDWVVWWRGGACPERSRRAPPGRGRTASPHSRIMIPSAMNSGPARNLDPPTIENLPRPNQLLSDWRVCVLALIALWAVIYMAGLSRAALLDDADTVHAEAAREMVQRHDWVTLYANGI